MNRANADPPRKRAREDPKKLWWNALKKTWSRFRKKCPL
jgi:hypothetical protein